MGKKARQDEQKVKDMIVRGYRAGVTDVHGCAIPHEKRGMAGKGSHYRGWYPNEAFCRNYDRIFGKKGAK